MAGVIITRHFLVLVTVAPFVFVFAVSMFEIYDYFWLDENLKDIGNYMLCLQTNSSSDCISVFDDVGVAVLHTTIPVSFSVFVVLVMIYSLFPGPARRLWAGYFQQCFRSKTKRKTICQSESNQENEGSRKRLTKDNCKIHLHKETDAEQKEYHRDDIVSEGIEEKNENVQDSTPCL